MCCGISELRHHGMKSPCKLAERQLGKLLLEPLIQNRAKPPRSVEGKIAVQMTAPQYELPTEEN